MAILILTIGKSDVQINRNTVEVLNNSQVSFFKDEFGEFLHCSENDLIELTPNRNYHNQYLLKHPRKGAQILLKYISTVLPFLNYPIIEPIIKYFEISGLNLEKIIFIFTDQEDEKYRESDTLYAKEIIRHWLNKENPGLVFDEIAIDRVTDIDVLYPEFRRKVNQWAASLPRDEQVYLADQGGIDQINQSLRLQLLQAFKSRVHILQKAEGTDVKELIFPRLFIRDLNKQNIIKHVTDYDFDKIDDTLQPESWVVRLCQYASKRLNLQYDKIGGLVQSINPALKKVSVPILPEWNWESIRKENPLLANRIIIRDLYIAAKIQFLNGRYNEFVWRIFTVYENLLREPIDALIGEDTLRTAFNRNKTGFQDNDLWNRCLTQLDPELKQKLKDAEIFTANPNRAAYSFIYYYLIQKGSLPISVPIADLKNLEIEMNKLAGKRNSIVHNMGNTTKSELGKWFKFLDAEGFHLINKWFGIQGMGDFDNIRNQILNYYQ